ncbi:helix-turn-helix domain-containing protein [Bradyrhizobium sp. USDA 4454]
MKVASTRLPLPSLRTTTCNGCGRPDPVVSCWVVIVPSFLSTFTQLRQIRLEAIHDELSRPENMLPVSEVALKWGFTHMSRFAAVYRSAFGLYPSDAVRRIRGFGS